ncbi:hypothetical protein TRFO_43221 [Tritrichomonas foetus]|uniref:Uncharacterized protein n=1 Tax=Tritrichomonas foetus TaxID=1144522 RepID=A0A1J4KS15_9EUKA|nr:hypothetical protein TRFO_43221 [Tritrichomonas foetus]|eukprot:OHT13890.1 hypothetical protein TRFO_43221 [Tritrichomonas foetus]
MSKKEYLGNFVIRDHDCNIDGDGSFSYYQNNILRDLINRNRNPVFAEINYINLTFPKPLIPKDKEVEYIIYIQEKWDGKQASFRTYSIKHVIKDLTDVNLLLSYFNEKFSSWINFTKNKYSFVYSSEDQSVKLVVSQKPDFPSPYSYYHQWTMTFSPSFVELFGRDFILLSDRQCKPINKIEKTFDVGKIYYEAIKPDPLLPKTYYFYHSDLSLPNMNQIRLSVCCQDENTTYVNQHRFYFHSLSPNPTCYFYGYNSEGKLVKAHVYQFTILITLYEEIFNTNKMKYIGNYVLNHENSKIEGDYIYSIQNNQVRSLCDTVRNKGKKLWVKIQQILVDPYDIPNTVWWYETQKNNKPTINRKFEFHYDFRNKTKEEILEYLNEEVVKKGLKVWRNADHGSMYFKYNANKNRFEYTLWEAYYTKRVTFTMSENMARILGFERNSREGDGHFTGSGEGILTYTAENLPNLNLDPIPENIPILYYYHPDLVSSNFNQEYVTAIYIHNHGMYEYDVLYDVRSLSPTAQTFFYYYHEGKKLYYTPRDFCIVLGFYESD